MEAIRAGQEDYDLYKEYVDMFSDELEALLERNLMQLLRLKNLTMDHISLAQETHFQDDDFSQLDQNDSINLEVPAWLTELEGERIYNDIKELSQQLSQEERTKRFESKYIDQMALDIVLQKENITEKQLRKVLNQWMRETEMESSIDTMKSEYDSDFMRDRQQELSREQPDDPGQRGYDIENPFEVNLLSSGSKASAA